MKCCIHVQHCFLHTCTLHMQYPLPSRQQHKKCAYMNLLLNSKSLCCPCCYVIQILVLLVVNLSKVKWLLLESPIHSDSKLSVSYSKWLNLVLLVVNLPSITITITVPCEEATSLKKTTSLKKKNHSDHIHGNSAV